MSKATSPVYVVYFRRRREGRTNFSKRLALVKSSLPRMVVRKSNRGFVVQFAEFDPKGDKVLTTVTGTRLQKTFGWPSKRNVHTAYLCGLLAASLARKKKVLDFVLDIGLHIPTKGSVVFAALKGALDAGLKTTFKDETLLPADKLANVPVALKAQFENARSRILAS
ncbi:50S ribosomal protein L18 [Candidatus Micrarchaeota archaeon]|nr:50S ribosomal protein L18 [Candidatus Micrarchaeota archaeon]